MSHHTLFISDLHLCPTAPQQTELFFHFMTHTAPNADALYILGDFFESYVGDDACETIFMQSIIQTLFQATQFGLPIYFMHGNRDFLVGKIFLEKTGMTLLPDPSLITLYGKKTLLMHGDSLCTNDRAHQTFRKFSHHSWIQKIFLCLPLRIRLKIAEKLRNKSQSTTKIADWMDVCEETLATEMQRFQATQLIHGHTHKPAIHTYKNGEKRLVMNAWHAQGNFLKITDNGEVHLIDF